MELDSVSMELHERLEKDAKFRLDFLDVAASQPDIVDNLKGEGAKKEGSKAWQEVVDCMGYDATPENIKTAQAEWRKARNKFVKKLKRNNVTESEEDQIMNRIKHVIEKNTEERAARKRKAPDEGQPEENQNAPPRRKKASIQTYLRRILLRIKNIETRMTSLEERMTSLEERVTRIEERVTRIEERVTNIETRVTRIEERVTNIETRVTKIETQIEGIETRLKKLETEKVKRLYAFYLKRTEE